MPAKTNYADLARALRDIVARCNALGDCSSEKTGQLFWVLQKHAGTLRSTFEWPDELSAQLFKLLAADCVAMEHAIVFSQLSLVHHPQVLLAPRATALADEARRLLTGMMLAKVIADQSTESKP